MPTLPADKALVRFRYTKDQPALPPLPPPPGSPPGTLPVSRTAPVIGTEDAEVFELDPPARDVAEVERQWREANKGKDKDWQDASFIDEPAAPATPPPPKQEPDVDAQGVRHRAAGQEVPPTVTKTEDAHPAPTGKGEAGDGLDKLSVAELQARAEAANVGTSGLTTKANLVAALRASQLQPADDGLDRLTVAELQSRADADGVKPDGPQNKANLIAAIRAKHGKGR